MARLACKVAGDLDKVSPAGRLAEFGGEVEVVVGRVTEPGHHVEDRGLGPAEAAPFVHSPGSEHLDAKSIASADGLIGENPLVFESAGRIGHFEGSHSHNEIIHKLNGYLQEPSVNIRVPFLKNHRIFLRSFDVVGVENQFTKMNIGDYRIRFDRNVPHIVGSVDDLARHVKVKVLAEGASDP